MRRPTIAYVFLLLLLSIIACKSGPIIIEAFKSQNAAFDEGRPLNRQLIVLQSPTPTFTATSTSMFTLTLTLTPTPTLTPTATTTQNGENTPTATKTTPSPTASHTSTSTATPTSTATATATPSPTFTPTFTPTPTPTSTHTPDPPRPSRPSVFFSSTTYRVNENVGMATIMVRLSNSWDQIVTVDYATSDGSAYGGLECGSVVDDYEITSGQLTFSPGETSRTFSVTICDDDIPNEPDLTVNLTLSNAHNADLGTSSATLVIVDDEPQPFIGFSSSNYSVYENTGPAAITVTLNASLPISVSVDYATSPGTATEYLSCQTDMDYEYISGTLTIPANFTSETFNVTICDDGTDEITETLTLTLSNPIGVPLGTINSATLEILDDDP